MLVAFVMLVLHASMDNAFHQSRALISITTPIAINQLRNFKNVAKTVWKAVTKTHVSSIDNNVEEAAFAKKDIVAYKAIVYLLQCVGCQFVVPTNLGRRADRFAMKVVTNDSAQLMQRCV